MFGKNKSVIPAFVPCKVCGKYPGVCVGDTFVHITCKHEEDRTVTIRADDLDTALSIWNKYFGELEIVDAIET